MAGLLITATLDPKDSIAEDPVTYSFVFGSNEVAVPAGAPDHAFDTVADFIWNRVPTPGPYPVVAWMSPALVFGSAACVMKAYDISTHLDGSPHGSPTNFRTADVVHDSSGDAPEVEAACAVLSYHADWGTAVEEGPLGPIPTPTRAQHEGAPATHTGHTRPRSRYRGRLYFGPISRAAIHVDGTTQRASIDVRAAQALVTSARQTLVAGWNTTGGSGLDTQWKWCVWSRRNAQLNPVTLIQVNSRVGYQRRRSDPGSVLYAG